MGETCLVQAKKRKHFSKRELSPFRYSWGDETEVWGFWIVFFVKTATMQRTKSNDRLKFVAEGGETPWMHAICQMFHHQQKWYYELTYTLWKLSSG